jgi:predicted O-methyltransferase YrrM
MSVLIRYLRWRLGLSAAEVWTTASERACLVQHAAGKRAVVEVGVWHGGTTRELRAAMAPDATLYAVDPFPRGRLGVSFPRAIARREVGRVANGRVIWLRSLGADAARHVAAAGVPVDFVLIDNAQTFETLREEWEGWSGLIVPGGIIALHDSRPTAETPHQTSVDYTRAVVLRDARFSTVDEVDSLTVLQRSE